MSIITAACVIKKNGDIIGYRVTYDDGRIVGVPDDPTNTVYQQMMALVEAGTITMTEQDL